MSCKFPLSCTCILTLCFSFLDSFFLTLCSWIKISVFSFIASELYFNLERPSLLFIIIIILYIFYYFYDFVFHIQILAPSGSYLKWRQRFKLLSFFFFPIWLPKMSYWIQRIDASHCSDYNAHKWSHKSLPTKVVNK